MCDKVVNRRRKKERKVAGDKEQNLYKEIEMCKRQEKNAKRRRKKRLQNCDLRGLP